MKQLLFLLFCLLVSANVDSQGVTLLYAKDLGWHNPESWVQLNVPAGQTPIQRVPTEVDDVILSKAMSGIPTVGIGVDQLSDTITVGVNRTTGARCHSLHISNTNFSTGAPQSFELFPVITVSTSNNGFILIDSNSTVRDVNFDLEGGEPDLYDLQLLDSEFGQSPRHNGDYGSIYIGQKGRAAMKNSTYSSFSLHGNATGGELYAENCAFTILSFRMGAASKVTLLKSTFTDASGAGGNMTFQLGPNSNFTSGDVELNPLIDLNFTTSGAVFNGNIKNIWGGQGNLHIEQWDPANPLPTIINGNVNVFTQRLNLSGDLKISGDFVNSAVIWDMYPDSTHYPDSSRVYINGQEIFKIGGISNYGISSNLNNCTQPGCHFKVEFFGDKNSNFVWPVGFPVDTLVINKTNCSKVTFQNPIYVSGQAQIKSGQLVLDPNDTIVYKLVCAGDVNISQGGGLFLRKNGAGEVANIAVAGSIYDQNINVDSTCSGFSNPYNSTVAFYKTAASTGKHAIALASKASIGDLNFIGEDGTEMRLENDLTVHHFTFTNPGKLQLGDHNLTINGGVANYGPQNYFVTDGSGKLQLNNIGSTATVFPVGSSAASYNPVSLTNAGTPDNFSISVADHVYGNGSAGSRFISGVVDKTWTIEEATPGGSNATVKLQWSEADELPGFSRAVAYLAHYTGGGWDKGGGQSAVGTNPYSVTRSGITSFSPFAVMGTSPALPLTLVDFSGQYNEPAVNLSWTAENAINVKSFMVEKSGDGQRFTSIATVPAVNGTQERRHYHFIDKGVLQKLNYYRLKTTDIDGSFVHSKTIAIATPATGVALIFPNPVKQHLYVQLPSSNSKARLQLFDLKGVLVKSIQVPSNSTLVPVDVSDLATGTYVVAITVNGETTKSLLMKQ